MYTFSFNKFAFFQIDLKYIRMITYFYVILYYCDQVRHIGSSLREVELLIIRFFQPIYDLLESKPTKEVQRCIAIV